MHDLTLDNLNSNIFFELKIAKNFHFVILLDFNEIEQQPQASLNDGEKLELSESNNTENGVSDALLETLEELVKPKEFKDIFFDDDDFTESSGSA